MDMEITSKMEEDETQAVNQVLNDLLTKVETTFNKNTSIFSFTNTCDSCASRDSLFWRRVARAKIVCNNCFFSQTYLLQFRETKSSRKLTNPHDLDIKNSEPIKKTRSSRVSSTTSSSCSSVKRKAVAEKSMIETNVDEELLYACITRKSARFINNSNKSKKTEINGKGKSSNKNNKKSKTSIIKPEDTVNSDKASPITPPNPKSFQLTPPNSKNRRTKLFKSEQRPPMKSPALTSTIFTSDFVFHRGFYMQVGDIVALFDLADEDANIPYFAQIRAFLTDQYGEKSAVLTWLIPIDSNYAKKIRLAKDFDSDMFILGPPEEYPRPLKCLEFVCRLVETAGNFKRGDYFNNSYQFRADLQRHKFMLNDLAKSNVKLITKKGLSNASHETEHEIKWN